MPVNNVVEECFFWPVAFMRGPMWCDFPVDRFAGHVCFLSVETVTMLSKCSFFVYPNISDCADARMTPLSVDLPVSSTTVNGSIGTKLPFISKETARLRMAANMPNRTFKNFII